VIGSALKESNEAMHVSKRNHPRRAIVALGANLPHEGLAGADLLEAAVRGIEGGGVAGTRGGGVGGGPAWPASDQPDYVNSVVEIDPGGRTPAQLLALLMRIEQAFGRVRGAPNAARTLDLDIIDFGGLVHEEEGLAIPHPRAHERAFVLAPLA